MQFPFFFSWHLFLPFIFRLSISISNSVMFQFAILSNLFAWTIHSGMPNFGIRSQNSKICHYFRHNFVFFAQNICDISQRHFRQFEHFYINFVNYFRLLNWSFTFSFSFFLKRLLCKHFWLRAKNLEFRLVFRFSAWFHSIFMFHVLLLLLLIYLPYSAVFGLRFSDFWYAEFCWGVCQKI